ncbi:MAG: hypothetical protein LBP33_07595, partial [Candidatus Adiutrix sp.]|nr:hypothetical protein [Candidatus Adiutrix sp.]
MPPAFKSIVIRKPDLDTIAAAFLAGATRAFHDLLIVPGQAPAKLLNDPAVLALECGGAGRADLLNFDHHAAGGPEATAVEQAWAHLTGRAPDFEPLVFYVAWVDSGGQRGLAPTDHGAFGLSGLLSGFLMVTSDPVERFWRGQDLVRESFAAGLPPWNLAGAQVLFPHWRSYIEAHEKARRALTALAGQARPFPSAVGPGLALSTELYGVHGLLRGLGAIVRLAHHPAGRFSVSVAPEHRLWLSALATRLNGLEPGWGGPAGAAIISSPFTGT